MVCVGVDTYGRRVLRVGRMERVSRGLWRLLVSGREVQTVRVYVGYTGLAQLLREAGCDAKGKATSVKCQITFSGLFPTFCAFC